MRSLLIWGLAGLLLALSTSGSATVLHVPSEYPTIQAGIDAATEGDTVLVADGTYTGDGNRDIDYGGKGIVVMSENGPEVTIIDCEGSGRGFHFHNGEDSNSVVQGVTIRNGYSGWPWGGGGIYCDASSPTIAGNILTANTTAGSGAAICCISSSFPVIVNNTIAGNAAEMSAGGICCLFSSSPTIKSNTITGNEASWYGAGIECWDDCSPHIVNNVITENTAAGSGGGIECYGGSSPLIEGNTMAGNAAQQGGAICCWSSSPSVINSIFWGDSAALGREIYLGDWGGVSSIEVAFSNVEGGSSAVYILPGCVLHWGEGNMDTDPLFVTGPYGDYYLSQVGAGQPEQSPCVDAGDPGALPSEGSTRTDEDCDIWPGDMGYHYRWAPGPTTALSVDIGTYTTQIPPGWDLWFAIDVVNVTNCTVSFDAWVDGYLPNGDPYGGNPVLGPVHLTFAGNQAVYDIARHVSIPGGAPHGEPYALYVRAGDAPGTIWAEDCIEFAIVPPPLE